MDFYHRFRGTKHTQLCPVHGWRVLRDTVVRVYNLAYTVRGLAFDTTCMRILIKNSEFFDLFVFQTPYWQSFGELVGVQGFRLPK